MTRLSIAFVVVLIGCSGPCLRHSDCPDQLICQAGACVMPPVEDAGDGDGAVGAMDAMSMDAMSMDVTSMDAAADAGTDAGEVFDASVDTSMPPMDGSMAAMDGAVDAGTTDADAPAPDGGLDASTDTGPTDAGSDAP